jgi:hypothetical protein
LWLSDPHTHLFLQIKPLAKQVMEMMESIDKVIDEIPGVGKTEA